MLKTYDYTEEQIEKFPDVICTIEDMIAEYGRQGEKSTFCRDCLDWGTCKGVKWSTCPYRKWYIKDVAKNKGKLIPNKCKRWTPAEKEDFIRMVKKGVSYKELASIFGRGVSTLTETVQQLRNKGIDIPIRTSHHFKWTTKRINTLIKMRDKGITNKEIAKYFDVKIYILNTMIKKLRKKGVINNDFRRR